MGTPFSARNTSRVVGILILSLLIVGSAHAAPFWSSPKQAHSPITLTSNTIPDLVKKLKPCVVNISVVKVEKIQGMPFHSRNFGPFAEMDPFRDFWERFFGENMPREFRQKGLGSGFIINNEGYILTNNHVIQKADRIEVILYNKNRYPAKVVGTDPKTDIALIKIEPKEKLSVAVLGDSDALRQGDPVVAIGNPFGLSETVTAGIVSAKGRVIGAGPYDDFIQTDASINPGNSGGPLFNFYGEVVGINAAIIATGQGIGFAIPINMAKSILEQLKEKGHVIRGWLGVVIQDITPELAKSFHLSSRKGALVADVVKDGPADKAHIQRGDVILEFNGKRIADSHELPQLVASLAPGTKVKITLLRDGKKKVVHVTLGTLKEKQATALETTQRHRFGMSIQTVTPQLAEALGMEKAQGVVVTSVRMGGPASEAGLRRGDVILELNHKKIVSVKQFKRLAREMKTDTALLLVWRDGNTFFVTVELR